MLDFLKRFGLGLVYILFSPFILAFLLLWGLYDCVIFIISIIQGICSFFKGQSFFPPFEEDIEANKILNINAIEKDENDIGNYLAINNNDLLITSSVENSQTNVELSHPNINKDEIK